MPKHTPTRADRITEALGADYRKEARGQLKQLERLGYELRPTRARKGAGKGRADTDDADCAAEIAIGRAAKRGKGRA